MSRNVTIPMPSTNPTTSEADLFRALAAQFASAVPTPDWSDAKCATTGIGAADTWWTVTPETATATTTIHRARAEAMCHGCPLMRTCLDFAIESGERDGIWGGVTPLDRGRMARGDIPQIPPTADTLPPPQTDAERAATPSKITGQWLEGEQLTFDDATCA